VFVRFKTPRRVATTVVILALCLVLPAPGFAAPTNAKIKAAQAQAEEARAKLDELQADLEERSEDYLAVEAELEMTRHRISVTVEDLAEAQAELDRSEIRLNGRADSIYRSGSSSMIAVFVGATDFRDLVTRIDMMQRIGRSDANLVATVKDAKSRTEKAMSTLERRRSEQTILRNQAREKKAQVEQAVAAQQSYTAKLDSTVKTLVAQERRRLQVLAAQRAAEAARLSASGNVGRAGRSFDPSALGGAHPDAVTWARKYVNKTWYVWGGTTPSGFDCSGLVQYCYRQIGIEIPRTSRQQYHIGAYIPPNRLDLLEPGDLVFFGRNGDPGRIHHVGMYIGGGQMIHAPQTGEQVSIASLTDRIARRGDYVGAVRP